MTAPSRVRAPFVPAACVVFAFLLSVAPAAAQGMLPFGQKSVPEEIKPLMQKPVGISFVSLNVGETLKVSDLALVLGGQPVPPGAVSLDTVLHSTNIVGVAADVWLLPFVNLHGMVGHVWGTASDIFPGVMPGLLPPGVTIPPTQDYGGTTYAGGVTFAMGYKRMFASYDLTYISSDVDLLNDNVDALTQSIRAGVKLGSGKIRTTLYGGALWESIRSTLTGTGLIPGLNPDFSLKLTPDSPWNGLAGANIELTPRFVVTVEGGFGNRMQFVIMPGVRF
jgi:hypothetical protein